MELLSGHAYPGIVQHTEEDSSPVTRCRSPEWGFHKSRREEVGVGNLIDVLLWNIITRYWQGV